MHLLILGPPGAGKGTQAARLAAHLGIRAISTGDVFRAAIADQTPLGRTVRRLVEAGEYVPDEITNALVRARLTAPDAAQGVILDGFPRTLAQAAELDAILAFEDLGLDAVLQLVIDPEIVVQRLLRRAAIEGRADDTEPVIRRRLELYAAESAPLTEIYRRRGLLVEVDGTDSVGGVLRSALDALRVGARAAA
jgi:adenylate kinase